MRFSVFVTGWVLVGSTIGIAQSPKGAVVRTSDTHRITTEQIDELRRVEELRGDRQVEPNLFSMPTGSRGTLIDSAELLHDLWSRMSRRERRFHFGHSRSTMGQQELDDVLAKSKLVVVHVLDAIETEAEVPLIDVDGDGVLDRVDAIRFSDPESPNLRLCGPTIVFERNQKLIVNLRNRLKENRAPVLEWNPGSEPPSAPDPPAFWMMDAPHDLFSTNLHTHGLHVSPGGGHDNAFLEVAPSKGDTPNEMFLDYELPGNHPAGTFWYHVHQHGSVAYQLANGMAGALIVPGDTRADSGDLESIPEIQAANRIEHPDDNAMDVDYGRVLLLQQLVFTRATVTDPDGTTRSRWIVDPADMNDRKSAPNDKNVGRITEGIPANKPESIELLAVNGQRTPSIEIRRGQIERWRLIHAGRESALNLAWYKASELNDASNSAPELTDEIESYEIATDGIPTGRLKYQPNTELYPGYRSDLLIRVNDKASDGEYWLLPSEAQRLTRTHLGPVKNALPVVKLNVKGKNPSPMQLPSAAKLERLKRPPPQLTGAEKVDIFLTFADKMRFGVATVPNRAGKPYAESGSTDSIAVTLDKPQVWKLGVREFLPGVAETIVHPFHMHVNPFYVPSLGVWKDTLAISRDEMTEIQFVPTDYAGRSVLHCHILDHEDQGMMKDVNLVGTSRAQYPDLYLMERLSEDERIKVPGMNLVPDKNNVLVFIAGMGCPHCAEGLVKLWKRSEPLKDLDASIKSMSATPFEQRELANLGLSKKAYFSFNATPKGFNLADNASPTDSELTASDRATVTHAVLIFDKQQYLRYRYLGDRPLSDLDEITYALMELKDPAPSPKGRFHRVLLPR